MSRSVVGEDAVRRRAHWLAEIVRINGRFGEDVLRIEQELEKEVRAVGRRALLDHLRLCGAMPGSYALDSSEEKLYAKYADVVLAVAFRAMGLSSLIVVERSGVADVEVVGHDLSFVADAKTFRLSRTAKNQKDFKVEAMHGWKRAHPFAMVVAPLYQFPSRASQIYQQAISRDVCLLSFAHIALFLALAIDGHESRATRALEAVLRSIQAMAPSKDAISYWLGVNRTMLAADERLPDLWLTEKIANLESLALGKEEGLTILSEQRRAIMRLSNEEAIRQLLAAHRIENRIKIIESLSDNDLLGVS